MAEKKPGFFDGLTEALNTNHEADSPELCAVKDYIDKMELSDSDRLNLAGWLFGGSFVNQIAAALKDD